MWLEWKTCESGVKKNNKKKKAKVTAIYKKLTKVFRRFVLLLFFYRGAFDLVAPLLVSYVHVSGLLRSLRSTRSPVTQTPRLSPAPYWPPPLIRRLCPLRTRFFRPLGAGLQIKIFLLLLCPFLWAWIVDLFTTCQVIWLLVFLALSNFSVAMPLRWCDWMYGWCLVWLQILCHTDVHVNELLIIY